MSTQSPHRPGFRVLAVVAAFTFGCVTVRAPASAITEQIPFRDGRAEPQLELWVESNGQVPPAEVAAAAAEARAALAEALEGQADPGEDWILVARARGVTRTPSRRHEQVAATVGLVLGAVVLVALVVVAVVASGKGGGKGGGHGGGAARGLASPTHAARPPGPGPVRAAPFAIAPRPGRPGAAGVAGVAGAVRPPPPALRPPPLRPPPAGPHPDWARHHHDDVSWNFQAGLELELWGPPGPPPSWVEEERLAWREVPGELPPAAAAPQAGTEGQVRDGPRTVVVLPAPPPLPVEERGYFDGDALEIELTLVDRVTGRDAWRKTARAGVDPRDRAAVAALIRPLLATGGWEPIPPGSAAEPAPAP